MIWKLVQETNIRYIHNAIIISLGIMISNQISVIHIQCLSGGICPIDPNFVN
jgi:hypothetical protein